MVFLPQSPACWLQAHHPAYYSCLLAEPSECSTWRPASMSWSLSILLRFGGLLILPYGCRCYFLTHKYLLSQLQMRICPVLLIISKVVQIFFEHTQPFYITQPHLASKVAATENTTVLLLADGSSLGTPITKPQHLHPVKASLF